MIEGARELGALAHHAGPRARMDREGVGLRVIFADGSARLHGAAGDALHPGMQLHHMGGLGEGRVGGGLVAHFRIDGDIGGAVRPQALGAGLDGVHGIHDGGQRLVGDLHQLRRIARLGLGLRDHHDHGFADEMHDLRGHGLMLGQIDLIA